MTPLDWAFEELDIRRREDRRFPVEPARGTREWFAFAEMKRDRAGRRKERLYSRATADALVARAAELDRMAA